MYVIPNVNFALSSNKKDQLRGLYDYLYPIVITAINALDGSTLEDNLIMSHKLDYLSPTLIPVKAVENNQELLALNKVGSTTLLN